MNGRDSEGWKAARQRLAARSAERIEQLRAADRPRIETEDATFVTPSPRTPSLGVTPTGLVALGLLLIGVIAAIYAGGKAILGGAADLREKQLAWVNQETATSDGVADDGFNETEAVTLCDLNMQAQAISPPTYRAAWSWRIERRDGIVAVRRQFTVMNPFGVNMPGEYTCLVAAPTNRVIGLQYESAGKTVTIPGELLRQ